MSPAIAIARILDEGTIRGALVASYWAARRSGVELEAAALAGRALEQHGSADAALESLRALRRELRVGRENMPLSEGEWDLVGACAYIRKVRDEEGGTQGERRRPTISDEDLEQ